MSEKELFDVLKDAQISVELDGESLVVKGDKGSVNSKVKNYLIENKASIVDLLKSGLTLDGRNGIRVPRNVIEPSCTVITPQMLPLIDLSQEDIDRIAARVPGGASNIQDIYELTPLQDGILFHHRLASEGDPYLLNSQIAFPNRERLDQFFSVVQRVIDRHDVLRTSFAWEGLSKPAQIVWRHARLSVMEVTLDLQEGSISDQLTRYCDPRRHRVELTTAPLLSYVVAHDAEHNRWLAIQRFHHLIGDHSTLDLLRSEIYAFHAHPEKVLALAEPFRNLVARMRLGPSQEEHEIFFRSMLGDITEPTLAFGYNDVYLQGDNIDELHRMLSKALNDRLRRQARRLGVSLASLCHLAWGLVLARSIGKEQAVFGTVLLGRMQASDFAKRAAGLFINTVPFRVDLSEKATDSMVSEMHARLSELLQHEHASLALAQRCSGVTGKIPLFNALLNYRHIVEGQKDEEGVDRDRLFTGVEFLSAHEERTNYPISLSVDDYGHALGLTVHVVRPLSADRLCGYMKKALESLVDALEEAPQTPICALNVLPWDERELLLATWNATAAPYPQDCCFHQLFEEQVRKTPHATAVIYADRMLSYGELNLQANRLAHHLIGLGVKPDDRVAICVERSAAMVIGLLAVFKAGAAYVPLDPAYPSERLSQVVIDAQPLLVLIDVVGRSALGDAVLAGRTCTDLEPLRAEGVGVTAWSSQSGEDPQVAGLTAQHLAYVIYTSGSTGMPKGVQVEHQQLANFLSAMASILVIKPSDSWLAVTSIAFDIAGLELYLPLVSGAQVVLASYHDTLDPGRLQRLMASHAIRFMQATPATWNALLSTSWSGDRELVALCGGEAMPAHYRARFQGRCKSLWNLYGPTETTIWSSCIEVALEASDTRSVSIGRPIANTQIYLLDNRREPVPLGAIGELYIGGAGVARGYLNRPELTAERFVSDPFAKEVAARMYRTGDLARYLPDGNIQYLGRNDLQVKIRGFRIELGEIEARLHEHAQVREAVVDARDTCDEKRLVAYVLPADETADTGELVAMLRVHLAATLPDYMVPAAFVMMVAFPLTPNGKLDRKALPAPDDDAYVRREYEAPQDETERALAVLWQELLRVERVGRHDDFFELGGHSLSATRLLVRIRQVLGVELPVAALFSQSTLAALSQEVTDAGGGSAQAMLPMAMISRDEPLPLSFAQQRLWFLAQLDGVSETYHIPLALKIRGPLDRAALRQSLDALMARHESLRSVFVLVDGQPQVCLLPEATALPLIEHDLRGRGDASLEMMRVGKEEAFAPFDLTKGPLIRSRLLQLAEGEHVLLLTQHHIVSDGWSIGVLSRELSALYQAFHQDHAHSLPALAIQYPDYAAWQRAWLNGERLERQIAYWREALVGAPVLLELPTDRPRPLQQDFTGARVPVMLDAELTQSLKQLSQRHGTTLFMTLMAAWAAVLSRLSGQDEVVIGTLTANRSRAETEGLIGFFVNTLALPIHLGESPSISELLSRVRTTSLAAQDHQDLPFEQVVEIVQPPRRLNHTPIFQILFNWQNAEMSLPDFNGVEVELLTTSYGILKFDLELSLSEIGDRIVGNLSYATALFDATTVQRQVGYLTTLLRAMVIDSEQPVASVDLLSDDERRLLAMWNATTKPYAKERCIHQLFEDQVRKTPQAPAVVHAGQVLSYGELNAQSNLLAHYLLSLGVKPDDRVAICVERCTAMVVGLLAILKAGGAYVPLDPTYPSERLNQIVTDAAPSLILADAAGRAILGDARLAGCTVLNLEASTTAWSSQSTENPQVAGLTSRHLAYVIYTSGSTGTPKGAMNEHRALINRLLWMQDAYALDGTDVVLQKTSFSFDVSVWEFFWTLLQGAALCIPAPELHKDPSALIELMVRAKVTTTHFVPSMLGMFLATGGVERCTTLRRVICSGEALQAIHVRACLEKLPGAQLHNLYGPTEAAIDVTAWTCPPSFEGNVVPIGRPIANTQIHLLDNRRQPVPLGAIGELYIGGAGVARGYLNRPELTAERFVRDPFAVERMARMYRTGDLARYLPDGNIEYLGRNDFQVKIRGFRIELGEIEARLGQHAHIREAVLEARGEGDDKRLVAYVLPVDEALETAELATVLRAYLATALPDYMLPSAFVRISTWPLTPNGKLDRKALPAPGDEAYVRREYEAPQGEVEQALATLWQELLQVERVGRYDNFFELGGHSLLLVQLVERLRRLHLKADLRQLFAKPTLHGLAATLERDYGVIVPANLITPESAVITPEMLPLIELNQEDIERIVKQVPGGIANVQDIYALAPMQEGILFHHRLTEDNDPYLLKTMVTFPNRELMDRFFDAVQQLVDRHDILRTAFIWKGLSTPAQVVWRATALSVVEWELDAHAGSAAEQLASRFDASGYRIDLAKAPLVRFIVAREPDSPRWIALQLVHHLIEDAFSMRIFREEIHAILQGKSAALAQLPPFRNLVARALFGLSPEQHEHFFQKMLGDVSEPTLPFGLIDVHSSGARMGEFERMLPQALTDRLRSRARVLGVGLASLCHLAWGQVLARVVGNECVVFGTVLFGRVQAGDGADSAAGVFINTLPLRLDLGEIDVESAARQTSERLAELLVHEQASLVVAQRRSRVAVTTPLFSSLLNYRNVTPTPSRRTIESTNSLVDVRWTVGNRYTNYPVLIDLEDSGSSLRCMTHIMQPLSAERVWNYVQQALTSMADALEESPETTIRSLNVLPADERTLLLETWNATAATYPKDRCVHQLFEEQVGKTPQASAVIHDNRVLSYAELNTQSNGLARHLIELGVVPGDPVVTSLERSALLAVAQLAILKAGAVYVPVDPQSPESRQDWIIDDCSAKLVLVGLGRTAFAARKVLVLRDGDYADASAPDPALDLSADHAAYVMYTSGSTGTPKGVVVPHRAISKLVINNGYADFNAEDRVAFASNPAFDASTLELWAPLLNGGAVVVIDQTVLLAPERFAQTLVDQAVSVLWLTVGLFNQYAVSLKNALPPLRYLMVGGDVLDPRVIGWVLRECPPQHLLNGYGPTETTTFATTYEITAVPDGTKHIPIGRPIAQTRIYILDAQFEPVPVGAAGEIYIGGAGVALGYLNRPELTQERFIPSPFVAGELVYKSGDMGRWRPDGVIEYLGRNDYQVKIRGYRIELGEIETLLGKHAQVREAVVDVRDTGDEKRLVVYVVPADAMIPAGELLATLRAYLSTTLPDYMVPAAFMMMDALPLTPNGKLDRKALPTPDDGAYVRREYEAPHGEVEQVLAGLWQELLRVEHVGRHDSFFELGGHSLLATRLLARIRQTLGLELPIAALFTHSTLAGLSQMVMDSDGAPQAWSPILTISRDEPMPLSFAQQRLWFLSQIDGVSATYHIPVALKIRGALDRDALRRGLDALMSRHESLRSLFVTVAGKPQVKLLPATTPLPLIDHDLRVQADASAELVRLVKAEALAPFDLTQGPLIRGRLIRLVDDEHVLLLTQHHIASDGWSIGVLSRELSALYRAFQKDQPNPLPALVVQYPDYAAWQRTWLSAERLGRQIAYWRDALGGAPILLELPTDRPRPAQQDFRSARVPIALGKELTRSLKQLSQHHGATLFMTLIAAWATVLSRLSGQDEVLIGTPTANRGRAETEGLIGFFVNILSLRINVDKSSSVSDLLAHVRETSLAAQDHQDLPFDQVVEIVKPPRRLNHTPIFQAAFNWQNNEVNLPDFTGLQVDMLATGYEALKFDLELSLSELDGQIVGSLSYASTLFDASTMQRHLDYLYASLHAMVADSTQQVVGIDLLSADERRLQLETWNATTASYPQDRCIHQWFEEQVRKTPQAQALTYAGHTLSYAELNAQANRLAHYLISLGVTPDDRVAICVERGTTMVVGLLAILKAGGAYVPLDPAYPSERLSQIVFDAAPSLVLIDSAGRDALADAALAGRTLIDLDVSHATGAALPVWSDESAEDPHVAELASDHLAYVIYTSGSTGMPKGVQVEHRQLTNFLSAMASQLAIETSDSWLAVTSIAFDIAGLELYLPLVRGAHVVLASHLDTLDPERLQRLVATHAIRFMQATPATWNVMLATAWPGDRHLVALCGGEAMPVHFRGRFQGRCKSLWNLYGPTETTIWSSCVEVALDADDARRVPIGRPISNTQMYLLDDRCQPVPLGAIGELYIGGDGVARGYFNRPELTAERFVCNPFVTDPTARMYRTGDLARYLPDGNIEYLGRNDYQVKIRGFRIEPGEIEVRLAEHVAVCDAVVLARGEGDDQRLVAYVVLRHAQQDDRAIPENLAETLRSHLASRLPDYMLPAAFVALEAFPLTPNGKLDRKALPAPNDEAVARQAYVAPHSTLQNALTSIWQTLLGLERVGIHDNFFEVGGNSLHTIALKQQIFEKTGFDVSVIDLFTYPSIAKLDAYLLAGGQDAEPESVASSRPSVDLHMPVAVIGMAGRFPDADDIDSFWSNIADGVESLRSFTREQLQAAGVDPASMDKTNFVPKRSLLDGVEDFDARYFGFTPREAEITDPQQRVLLECAHDALEMAGHGDAENSRSVGVFVGIGESQYAIDHLLPQIQGFAALGASLLHGNSKDYVATRISYKLNLSGPSISVNTACSTSLVAVHQACCSLAFGESRMALAGGASIGEFGPGGYLHHDGDIQSPDGHCRAFDHQARGTRRGNGAGVVLLKRLDHALADGDTIHAVIRGSSINNDGSDKVGYTAPSVAGQARVIATAYRNASVAPSTIQYVEAHGTGTVLGDPIEVRALSQAFAGTATQSCAIGSVKPNIGHLDAAAGVAGLIKTVQAIKHRRLPPSINYEQANPQIDFANSPFYVNTQSRDWPRADGPRRAGVSSFGIGGTNAHVVLEEAPATEEMPVSRALHLLVLSARSPAALQLASTRLAKHLQTAATVPLADVAYTLQVGRAAHAYRRAVVCATPEEAIEQLTLPAIATEKSPGQNTSLVWMFPGQGSQHVDMARGLYASEPVFRMHLDACADELSAMLGLDLREVLYPSVERREDADIQLGQTWLAQPALFAVEYSLARLLQSYGLQPEVMIGHSLGEYVAACLAGVYSLQDGLRMVVQRGRLMQGMATGRMLSVLEDVSALRKRLLGTPLSLAAVNGGGQCVVSGPIQAIETLRQRLDADGIASRELETSHAFHSAMMEPMLATWREVVLGVKLSAPKLAYVSNLSGTFIRAQEATDAEYWVKHLRETVRFADGLATLLSSHAPLKGQPVLLEVGPGQVLSGLAKRQLLDSAADVVPLLARAATDDARALHNGLGQLWRFGARIDWAAYHGEGRRRVPLPTYPFERVRFWVDPPRGGIKAVAVPSSARREWQDWFQVPSWRLMPSPGLDCAQASAPTKRCIVFVRESDFSKLFMEEMRSRTVSVFSVISGVSYAFDACGAVIDVRQHAHYVRLFDDLKRHGYAFDSIVHAFNVEDRHDGPWTYDPDVLEFSLHSVLYLVQALNECMPQKATQLSLLSSQLVKIADDDAVQPEKAVLTGICRVIPREFPHITCKAIDVPEPSRVGRYKEAVAACIALEVLGAAHEAVVAYRGERRWVQAFERVRIDAPPKQVPLFRPRGVYLITGGLGGIGLTIATYLAESVQARLVLVGRSGLPPRATWQGLANAATDSYVSGQIRQILQLEARGSEVIVARADVADVDQMRQVAADVAARFGTIHGVIHAAGVAGDGLIVSKTRESVSTVIGPKIGGTAAVAKALEAFDLDVFVLCSSMNAITGGLGQFDYSAANTFLDAFAMRHDGATPTRYVSINWGAWKEVGMAANMRLPAYLLEQKEHYLRSAIGNEEGVNAFAAVLARPQPQWLVTTSDPALSMTPGNSDFTALLTSQRTNQSQQRPELTTAYLAPTDGIETSLIGIWQELLGFEGIGMRDEFFELGGDSLLATRLLSRIREVFPATTSMYSMRDFFEAPTVQGITDAIRPVLTMARLAKKRQDIQREQDLDEGVF